MPLPPALWNFARAVVEAGHFGERKTIVRELGERRGRVLDVPCGSGIFSDLFDDDVYSGVDADPRLVEYARRKFPGKRFEVMDALSLEFDDESFDTVLVIGFLHHLDERGVEGALDEVRRVLRRGGRFLLIEDHPTRAAWNLFGRCLQALDAGESIRPAAWYAKRLAERFALERSYPMRAGVWDYEVFVLTG